MNYKFISSLCFYFLLAQSLKAQKPYNLIVKADQPVASVQPTMWGIFFEDINFAADGGLYAELIKNRSFEFSSPLMGWTEQQSDRFSTNKESGYIVIVNKGEQALSNPRFARVNLNADKGYGITNEGFRGMGIKKDMQYNFSLLASLPEEGNIKMRIELVDNTGKIIGESSITTLGKEWKKYTTSFKATATESKAKLNIWFDGKGVIEVDMISLFPNDTWKNRPNGLRADLVQLLADLKPGFLRFPGGCIVEGRELDTRYQWKKTVGDIGNRKLIVNRWNTEFSHRPAPDYFQTFGLGFYEYFQLAEDIGASPLPILSCGMACQFNTAEVVPLNQLDPYIQDALDLIEFANGSSNTPWGKVRTEMGHPASFNLKMIGVGNEQWGAQYIDRYKIFVKAIKEKYPSIKIVTGNGPFPDGELFDFADKALRALHADIIDEHYYRSPEWFLENVKRYDAYDRSGPKIFAGEYAAQSVAIASSNNKNNWQCALSEAAFMTGLERNAGVVTMCSYAPLFGHAEGWQWTPNLIWFDNLNSFGTPNYYVQKLFSNNKGSMVLPITFNDEPVTGQNGLYASAVRDDNTREIILKIINSSDKAQTIDIALNGVKNVVTRVKSTLLKSDKLDAVNSVNEPKQIAPVDQDLEIKGKKINYSLSAYSFLLIRIATR